ncbi:leucine rich repeats and calponin homology domain containing 3 [Homo sapiens]|uniref:Isoform 2 of DISP complex protein LRCH3 n=1 Tax=Homo sapiens TaxID=9606 RepID=Q96II8-2|nr:DISP complex protein LRCH3 isoform 1 [Homo sapiens]EAW92244.1 leucine-rich repeats and calponin homology (CH) domain containing 3, isoform CRA_c [Homo sapiens]KAI2533263.1 leucine rich repeats and calponin-likey domain containing 3 [Homo sapiens]KAI2533264.1 leucine rich repeats and calponin-likey domain containing 3 [Homo sapiens]KAI4033335.1 leucine rich repeats and calponin homology domain containing 3 [Homo sapiens]KAI4033336.1 leucine rich repeats and calponin homology domain containin|eukprot:XP_005269419.1 leucine-rich repeat and calponin homology domain-containing protein 3 isoform X1 [Homo sapiens]
MAAAGLVAVAAAAEYSGTVASGGNLPGVHCGPSSGAGPGFGPGSWSRSLDRALEEAAVTGVLSLSGRKLREFPRGAANHDLTDTTRADLSRNRLSEIPIEACHFVSLENLNLYQNCIRYIPEAILNLQALTFLNISRNQLSTLPVHLCNLPLKVLIASNNKLVSLPEEIGHLRHLMELDVSCNEIQTIPSQIGNLEALRDLNVRRNHLVHLPEELAELPLIRLDFSCNKITTIPVCYRNLRHLQTITLDNNPLQSPPAQICIKGKVHIFKYLNIQACKIAPDLPDYDRRPLGFGSCHEELYSSRPYGALDSGFNSVDSGDKRWSGNEPTDEFSDLPLRVAEITKEQRLRRESQYQENRGSLVVTNGGVEHDLDQIDYIDSCTAEEEEAEVRQPKGPDPDSLSSQFMAYIEQRRISHEGSPVKPVAIREFQKTEDMRRYLHQNRVPAEPSSLLSLSASHNQLSHTDLELHQRREQLVERTRREAQLAALQYEEEKIRTKQIQRDAVLDFVKQKASQSPQKQHPLLDGVDGECPFPSRRSQHTDDSALCMSLSGLNQVGCAATLPHSSAFTPLKSDDRPNALLSSPATETVHHSPAYSFPAAIQRNQPQRPESFLFRAGVRAETNKGHASPLPPSAAPTTDSTDSITGQNSRQREEELELIDQLRKHIEYRLKVSLPCDLGAALTDGVVLCHLANHVRPRSVPSIHVPSPAVPKLTMAKCRRNVENFLEACRKIGVPQDNLCSPSDILQLNLSVKRTVETLLSLGAHSEESSFVCLSLQLLGFVAFYCTVMLTLCVLYYWLFPAR